jgi:hypothetical protein
MYARGADPRRPVRPDRKNSDAALRCARSAPRCAEREPSVLSIRQWRPKHLLIAWSAYWAGLAAFALGPAIAPLRRVAAPEVKGTVAAGYNDGSFHLTIGDASGTIWEAAASMGTVALWVTIPPLIIWGIWLMARRPDAGAAASAEAPAPPRAIDAGPAEEFPLGGQTRRDPARAKHDRR